MGAEDIGIGSLGIYSGLSFPHAKTLRRIWQVVGGRYFLLTLKNGNSWQVMAIFFMIYRCERKKNAPFCHFFKNRQIEKKLLRLNGGFLIIKLNQF